jgi:uncharacterized protein (TIGR03790 family)
VKLVNTILKLIFSVGAWFMASGGVEQLWAGGSGLNTVLVVNQRSSNSCALANYYAEKRAIPPENIVRLSWSGGNVSWTSNDFVALLLDPLASAITNRGITNQITHIVISMDIPFQTIWNTTNINSTTSALFYGLKTYLGSQNHTNSYSASEADFLKAKPASATGESYLATMLTGRSLSEAMHLVDQGVNSDGAFPDQPVVLAQTTDPLRNIRRLMFDNAIINANISGGISVTRTNSDDPSMQTNLMGYQTGLYHYNVSPGTFCPGAIADNVTSFGGVIFGLNDQTNLFAFIGGGAAGSYGTVAEPQADTEKFSNPQVFFYQSRGFSLAECYYQSVNQPYLGLTVAEPLAAPFASRGTGHWATGVSNSTLTGLSPLTVDFSADGARHPIQQIDLFVDGKFHYTLTNLAPEPGNVLSVSLNGYPVTYIVPTNATIRSIASNITTLINIPASTNATKVKAIHFGDRVELQSINTNHAWFPIHVANSFFLTTGNSYRVTYLPESFPPRLLPTGLDKKGAYRMQLEIPTRLNYVIQATTNLTDWQPIFTNTVAGLVDFTDSDTANHLYRFYRVEGPVPNLPPKISSLGFTNGGVFRVRAESQMGQACAIAVSTNQADWVGVITNQLGGVLDFMDTTASNSPSRFYRAWLISPPSPGLLLTNSAQGTPLAQVIYATRPYIVEVQTNGVDWFGISTNLAFQDIDTTVGSSAGSASSLSTFIHASRSKFFVPNSRGVQEYTFLSGTLTAGAWVQFTFTLTNQQKIVVGVTNAIAGISSTNLAFALCNLIATNSALQGSDGVTVENYSVVGGQAKFTIQARSPGYAAAQLAILPERSSFSTGVSVGPGSYRRLIQNSSDLQPRNHLYVTAGAYNLTPTFSLDTTTLPDGYHELTAVAYEGSSVRTQTRTTVPVQIQNTSLTATMTLLGLTNNASAQGSYQIQVTANTNNINSITLFTTGGAMAIATNVSDVIFPVHGTNLWEGLHPFYALVEAATGKKYRTRTEWIRLSP